MSAWLKLVLISPLMTGAALLAQAPQNNASKSPAPPPPLPPLPPNFSPATVRQFTNPAVVNRPELQPSSVQALPKPGLPQTLAAFTNQVAQQAAGQPHPLVWDAEVKEYIAQPGDTNANFTFNLTNASPSEVTIERVQTSCGCTVAKLPSQPWKLAPGTNGQIEVTVDLRGKRGQFSKMVYVYSSAGTKNLTVKVNVPDAPPGPGGDRARNMQIATADRQAVFKAGCADCHSKPAVGRKGKELYAGVCGVCHDAEHRATMVPDLHNLNHSTDRIFWKVWISQGKVGSLMPAFAQTQGGPLSDEQIDSLVDYLAENVPSRPAAAPMVPVPAGQ
jgi:mono/diheme cytochrome c family protein